MKIYVFKVVRVAILTAFFTSAVVLLLAFGDAAKIGAVSGIFMCGSAVIPALFPFMVVCEFFDRVGGAAFLSRVFAPIARVVFGKEGKYFAVYIMSVLGGYPVGALCIARLYEKGIDACTAKRLTYFCTNASPAFVVLAVGQGMFFSRKIGVLLFASHIISSLLLGVIITHIKPKKHEQAHKLPQKMISKQKESVADAFVNSTAGASKSILCICSLVVLFSSVNEIAQLLIKSNIMSTIFTAVGEITTACAMLAPANPAFTAAALGFGGVCVHLQIIAITKPYKINYPLFFLCRVLQGGISFVIMLILMKMLGITAPPVEVCNAVSNLIGSASASYSASPAAAVALCVTCLSLICSLKINKYAIMNKAKKDKKDSNKPVDVPS